MILTIFFLTSTINAQCWQKVSSGNNHTLAIKTDGTLWAWGNNEGGQLGDGTTINKYTTTQIGTDSDWQSVAAGSVTSYGIKTNGTLWAWGNGGLGELGNGGPVLGDPDFNENNYSLIPIQVGTENNWYIVKAGIGHIVALKNDGTLWAWGYNAYGQVGEGTSVIRNIPIQIGSENNWQFIDCGYDQSFAIKNDGTLWAWGQNDKGQLGDGTNTDRNSPIQISTENNWQQVSTGAYTTIAIKTEGTLWTWGSNESWQLGTGEFMPNTNVPAQVGTETTWHAISSGAFQVTALKTDRTLWVWGEGFYGFGDGTNISKDKPTQISNESNWQNISAGGVHTSVLKTDNTLWNWGWNFSGQLANGTNTGNANNNTQNTPIQVSCLSLGIEEDLNGLFIVYPNPTTGLIKIKPGNNIIVKSIKITDLTGKLVLNAKNNLLQLNIQNLEAGVYILSIITENKSYNTTIIKE